MKGLALVENACLLIDKTSHRWKEKWQNGTFCLSFLDEKYYLEVIMNYLGRGILIEKSRIFEDTFQLPLNSFTISPRQPEIWRYPPELAFLLALAFTPSYFCLCFYLCDLVCCCLERWSAKRGESVATHCRIEAETGCQAKEDGGRESIWWSEANHTINRKSEVETGVHSSLDSVSYKVHDFMPKINSY